MPQADLSGARAPDLIRGMMAVDDLRRRLRAAHARQRRGAGTRAVDCRSMHDRLPALGVFLVRATLGLVAFLRGLYHGFGLFGGPGVSQLAAHLDHQNAFAPTLMAWTAVAAMLVCGVLLMVGAFHRFAAIAALVYVAVAVIVEGRLSAYFIEDGGFEYLLLIAAMAACVLLAGPGRPALQVRVESPR